MKKVFKYLFVLALIPALTGCSGDQNISAKDAQKLVNGEGDYAAYKHDSTKVAEKYAKVKASVELSYSSKKSPSEIAAMEDGEQKSLYQQQYNVTRDSLFGREAATQTLALDALVALSAASQDGYVAVDALNAVALTNAGALISSYLAFLENEQTMNYPNAENCIYNFNKKELHLDYTVSYEKGETWTIESKDSTQLVGFAYNVDATYGEVGELKELSYIVTSAHNGDDTTGEGVKFDSYDYFIGYRLTLEYQKR